jgi:hypothetical protein
MALTLNIVADIRQVQELSQLLADIPNGIFQRGTSGVEREGRDLTHILACKSAT